MKDGRMARKALSASQDWLRGNGHMRVSGRVVL